jgi:hypothetical protein
MPDKYTQYLLQHRESIAKLITQHGASLPATTEADTIRRHLLDHIATLSGLRGPVDPVQLCKDTYTLLGDIGLAHQAAHQCRDTGSSACPYLKSIHARRASMARAGIIF